MSKTPAKGKIKRGFALLSPDKLKEVSKKGGKSTPPEKRFFSQNPNAAAELAQQPRKR